MLKDKEESGIHSESENKFEILNREIFSKVINELDQQYDKSYEKKRIWFYFDLEDLSFYKSGSSISLRPRNEVSQENTNYMLTFKVGSISQSIKHRVEFDAEFEAMNSKDPKIIQEIIFSFFNQVYKDIAVSKQIPRSLEIKNDHEIKLSSDISYESFKELLGVLELLEIDISKLFCTCSFEVESKRWEVFLSQLKNDRIEISCDHIKNISYYNCKGEKTDQANPVQELYELEVDQSSSHRRTEKQGPLKEYFLNFTETMRDTISKWQEPSELNRNKYQRVMDLNN